MEREGERKGRQRRGRSRQRMHENHTHDLLCKEAHSRFVALAAHGSHYHIIVIVFVCLSTKLVLFRSVESLVSLASLHEICTVVSWSSMSLSQPQFPSFFLSPCLSFSLSLRLLCALCLWLHVHSCPCVCYVPARVPASVSVSAFTCA